MRRRWIVIGMAVAAAGLAVSIVGMAAAVHRLREATPRPTTPDPSYADLQVPPFTLVDQDGRKADQSLFDGRVTVLDFIFTNCPFACPMMTLAMQDTAERLADTPVQLVSISVDPSHDTPEALRRYADARGIDTRRWTFLTGDFETVKGIATGALNFALEPDPARPVRLPDGTTMPNMMHPTQLILIGPDRRVIGIYSASDDAEVRRLAAQAREVSRGAAP